MRYSKEQLSTITGGVLVKDGTASNPTYDWLDIVAIPQRPLTPKKSLLFTTHSDGTGGWDNGFDRRPTAHFIAAKNGWHLATEQEPEDCEYLQFTSLVKAVSEIYKASRAQTDPFIIGVTGSVGKTTTVSFLKHMLNTEGHKATRFYSKRLTPLSLMCHYINRVESDTEFVVMEYSAYLAEHVDILASILPPNLAFLTNIYETHINAGMFENKLDILMSKIKIKKSNTVAFANRTLESLGGHHLNDWQKFSAKMPNLLNPNLPPTLRTAELYSVAKIVSNSIGLKDETINQAFLSFVPTENRILRFSVGDKNIFYHGETSGGSRLWSWFETTNNEVPWLFVDEINFADEDEKGFRNLLSAIFSSEKTFVLDSPNNRTKLKVNAKFLSFNKFREKLNSAVGYVVYHKALSTRDLNFDPLNYLKTILE